MISYNDIKEAVCAKLYAAGYRVRDERVTDSMLDMGALVLVTLSPVTSMLTQCGKQENRALIVDCAYLESDAPERAAMYDALEGMTNAIQPYIETRGRKLKPQEIQYSITDGVAHFSFTLDYYDLTDAAKEKEEKIQILELKEV
ncbi:MAG: DUF6838 family protein [Christensenellaceae bacterium]